MLLHIFNSATNRVGRTGRILARDPEKKVVVLQVQLRVSFITRLKMFRKMP